MSEASPVDPQKYTLPPATFALLVLSLRAQCEVHLGLMNFGQEAKPEPDLDLARLTPLI